MKEWYVQKSCLASSDGTPVGGDPPLYYVMDEKDRQVCHTYDLKLAIMFSSSPEMLSWFRRLISPDLTDKEKNRILAGAAALIHSLDNEKYDEVPSE